MDTKYKKVSWAEVAAGDVVFLHYPTNLLVLEEDE
jgi:hypothetical protein